MPPEICWLTLVIWLCVVSQSTPVLSLGSLSHLFFMAHTGVTEPLTQSVLYSTFLLLVASAVALLMLPHGHNRGIMVASTPLSQSLSWGGKLLIPGVGNACVSCVSTNKHSTLHSTYTNTCTHINKQYKTNTQTQNGDLCPTQIDFTATLYLRCGMAGATMAFDTSHRMTTMSSNLVRWPTTMGLSFPQSRCHSSAWSLGQSSVTEVPIELEQFLTKEALTWCFQPSCKLYHILGSMVWR